MDRANGRNGLSDASLVKRTAFLKHLCSLEISYLQARSHAMTEPAQHWRNEMDIVKQSGGLHNTIAMEFHDKGYDACTEAQKQMIDARVKELVLCPQCGDKPTYRTPDGTFWDSNAHHWRDYETSRRALGE
jgi:hypothetical protein